LLQIEVTSNGSHISFPLQVLKHQQYLTKIAKMTVITPHVELVTGKDGVIFRSFDIPGVRIVHGNVFPLGLQLSSTSEEALTADKAAEAIREVAKMGRISELLNKHGALLIRGVDTVSPDTFSALIHASEEGRGRVPYEQIGFSGGRITVGKHIFSASEAPPHVKIDQHNEVIGMQGYCRKEC
jgi:hypothetical protein